MVRYSLYILVLSLLLTNSASSQTAEEVIQQIRAKLEKVNDYEAKGKMKTNVTFIKIPIANVTVYFKRPDKLRIKNEKGMSFVPKGTVNLNLSSLFTTGSNFDIIDVGKESGSSLRVIKMLPREENADIVLSTLYIDEQKMVIKKAKTTTRENGTYELELSYGKYAEYGLADKVIFSFNTKDYKLPKGVTFDYDDGSGDKTPEDKLKNRKGKVEITYSNYSINKGVPDSVFNSP
jgi:outer membrane lipoprotein-sorting protein